MKSSCLKQIELLKKLYSDIDNEFCSQLELILDYIFHDDMDTANEFHYDIDVNVSGNMLTNNNLIFCILLSPIKHGIMSSCFAQDVELYVRYTLNIENKISHLDLSYGFVIYTAYIISQIFLYNWINVPCELFTSKETPFLTNKIIRYFLQMYGDGDSTIGRNENELSYTIKNENIIKWSFNGEDQDPCDEIYMIHCFHRIYYDYQPRIKSARF